MAKKCQISCTDSSLSGHLTIKLKFYWCFSPQTANRKHLMYVYLWGAIYLLLFDQLEAGWMFWAVYAPNNGSLLSSYLAIHIIFADDEHSD